MCRLFQKFAEEGHYKGRVQPSKTRQGIYAVTPRGTLLASCNTRRADVVAKMLHRALSRWQRLAKSDRGLVTGDGAKLEKSRRWADHYPKDGLVLRITTRDLPRAKKTPGWRGDAWNLDFAWFKKYLCKR